MSFRYLVLGAAALCGVVGVVSGCSDDDPPANTSSTSSSSSGSSGATSTSSSGGTSGSSGTSGSGAQSLYDRLGKKQGIATAISAIVKAELADPEIASYFVVVGKTGRAPSAAAIEECLVNQLGSAAGGPAADVKYPTTVVGGFTCRDMRTAHTGLGIPPKTFDKFVTIAAGVLKGAGVADEDITTIGTVLNGTKTDVAQDTTREEGPFRLDAGS